MHITEEMVISSGLRLKARAVLPLDELKRRLKLGATIIYVATAEENEKLFFYTDDNSIGLRIPEFERKGFIVFSYDFGKYPQIKRLLKTSKENALKKFEEIFFSEHRRIETLKELVDILNG